jgi:hypothetical protein
VSKRKRTMNKIARLTFGELADLTEGIIACGQVPAEQLARIASLPDDDYVLALQAYQFAAMFTRRQRMQLNQQAAA